MTHFVSFKRKLTWKGEKGGEETEEGTGVREERKRRERSNGGGWREKGKQR